MSKFSSSAALPIPSDSGHALRTSPGMAPLRGPQRREVRQRTVPIDLTRPGETAQGRLLVHLLPAPTAPRWSWAALLGRRSRAPAAERWTVRLSDLQGQQLLCVEESGAVVDITLAPGTYDVRVTAGAELRQYTVALGDGEVAALQPQHGERRA